MTLRDFNYDLLKVSQNKLSYIFTDHFRIVKKPRHISESFIDQFYIKKASLVKFVTNVTVENIYAVRIVIEKVLLIFILIHKK